jgi:septum formation inhibitor-activating ATPase MinD
MAKIVVVTSGKGGVGKTTTSVLPLLPASPCAATRPP